MPDRIEFHFGVGDVQRSQTDSTLAERVLPGEQHDDCRRKCADEVSHIDDAPIAEQQPRADLLVRPRHHDQVVAGEQLGASRMTRIRPTQKTRPPNNRFTPYGRADPPDLTLWCKIAPERDEGARQNCEHEYGHGIHVRLPNADRFRSSGHFGRQERINREFPSGHVLKPSIAFETAVAARPVTRSDFGYCSEGASTVSASFAPGSFSTFTAHTLNSGIFASGSSAGLVRKFTAESGKWKVAKTSPAPHAFRDLRLRLDLAPPRGQPDHLAVGDAGVPGILGLISISASG